MLHVEYERWKVLGLRDEKVQKIPLRHEGDELATRGQFRKIRHWNWMAIKNCADFAQFLVRLFEELFQ